MVNSYNTESVSLCLFERIAQARHSYYPSHYFPRKYQNWQKKVLSFGVFLRFFVGKYLNGWDSRFYKALRLTIALCPLRALQSDTFLTRPQSDKESPMTIINPNQDLNLNKACFFIRIIFSKFNNLLREYLSLTQRNCITEINGMAEANCLLSLSPVLFERKDNRGSFIKNPKILLVEDNELVASIHKNFLLQLNCKVEVAPSGKEALSMADKHYDLILIDIGLPDISGIEVAKALRLNLKNECPHLIAVTAFSGEDILKACLAAGIEQVITKPISLSFLKSILSSFNCFHDKEDIMPK
jgi:CheY-like chemotaxis protein